MVESFDINCICGGAHGTYIYLYMSQRYFQAPMFIFFPHSVAPKDYFYLVFLDIYICLKGYCPVGTYYGSLLIMLGLKGLIPVLA